MRTTGLILIIVSLLYAGCGTATFFFDAAPARLLSLKEKSLPEERYSSRRPLLDPSPEPGADIRTFYEAGYTYRFNGAVYTSSLIGFYFPTSDDHNSFDVRNGYVTAYVCPLFPRFSVLVQGFQLLLMLPFIASGAMILICLAPQRGPE